MAIPDERGRIGLLHSEELSAVDRIACLAPQELAEFSAISHPRRREEWLAGRIAAKCVYLERECTGSSAPAGELVLQHITGQVLAQFPLEAYREAIVRRDTSPGGGPAQIGWRSGKEQVRVGISHACGHACAYIGSSDIYAVDLEAPAPRIPAFYLHNFTPRERSWTGDCARSFHLDANWLYTLLWSAKECLLKTPAFRTLSLWNMSSMEIQVVSGSERLKALHGAASVSGNFEFLHGEISLSSGATKYFQLAVGGTANLIVAAMTKLD